MKEYDILINDMIDDLFSDDYQESSTESISAVFGSLEMFFLFLTRNKKLNLVHDRIVTVELPWIIDYFDFLFKMKQIDKIKEILINHFSVNNNYVESTETFESYVRYNYHSYISDFYCDRGGYRHLARKILTDFELDYYTDYGDINLVFDYLTNTSLNEIKKTVIELLISSNEEVELSLFTGDSDDNDEYVIITNENANQFNFNDKTLLNLLNNVPSLEVLSAQLVNFYHNSENDAMFDDIYLNFKKSLIELGISELIYIDSENYHFKIEVKMDTILNELRSSIISNKIEYFDENCYDPIQFIHSLNGNECISFEIPHYADYHKTKKNLESFILTEL